MFSKCVYWLIAFNLLACVQLSWASQMSDVDASNDKNAADSMSCVLQSVLWRRMIEQVDLDGLTREFRKIKPDVNELRREDFLLEGGEINKVNLDMLFDQALSVHHFGIARVCLDLDMPIDGDGDYVPLVACATKGEAIPLRFLLDCGASVGAIDIDDNSALSIAIEKSHIDCVRILLDRGANVSGEEGYELLFHAICKRCPSVVEMLLDAGVNPSGRVHGQTALETAIHEDCREEIIQLLFTRSPSSIYEGGLKMAYRLQRTRIAQFLIERGTLLPDEAWIRANISRSFACKELADIYHARLRTVYRDLGRIKPVPADVFGRIIEFSQSPSCARAFRRDRDCRQLDQYFG